MTGTYRKIDLYLIRRNPSGRITAHEYICSTNWSRTCRGAVAKFHDINGTDYISGKNLAPLDSEIKGYFA